MYVCMYQVLVLPHDGTVTCLCLVNKFNYEKGANGGDVHYGYDTRFLFKIRNFILNTWSWHVECAYFNIIHVTCSVRVAECFMQ